MIPHAALIRPNPARPAPVDVTCSMSLIALWHGYTSSNALTAYEVLNIRLGAVSSEPNIATLVQVQYQTLTRCFHPDQFSATGNALVLTRCNEIMQKLNEANEAVREAVRCDGSALCECPFTCNIRHCPLSTSALPCILRTGGATTTSPSAWTRSTATDPMGCLAASTRRCCRAHMARSSWRCLSSAT
ncbi:hypothetical protein T492DRAFT_37993 [Pavlovales sp. CCMP2436]|nr:hypothetical protein T492DRAFT_37993 [Pavlovales sp. CCMP2436]